MTLSRPFILRPIGTSLLIAGLVLAGFLGFRLLPVASLPTVDFPTIQVVTDWPGASAQTMEALVTAPLEKYFERISGMNTMTSTSSMGISTVTLRFDLGRDIDAAAQDVQAAINAAGCCLPRALPYPPVYRKVNPADTPILVLAITSELMPLREVTDYIDTVFAQKLSQIEGVGLVQIEGGQKPAIRVKVNPGAIAALQLTLEDVRAALIAASPSLPKGNLDGSAQSYIISASDQLLSAEAYRPIVVAYRNGGPVRLGDIATVEDGVENSRLAGWVNRRPAILLDVYKQPNVNIIETVERVRAALPRLQATVPQTIDVAVLIDRTETIRASVADVQFTLALAVGLVVMVIFLFLRKLWATVIPSVTLPVSLIGTFGVMYLAGFSLDNLSLMALTISTGFVVDDAIVMIENIARYVEKGERPLDAALKGARQIGFTVVSLTISLVAVFIPLLFMGGVVGRLFREFAITLSVAVIISGIISLTLTPMMCAYLLGPEHESRPGPVARAAERGFAAILDAYASSLRVVLRHQAATLAVVFATLAATIALYVSIPKGFLPLQDTGLIIGVTEAAPDISFRAMTAQHQAVAEIVSRDPDVVAVGSFLGTGTINPAGNVGRLYITLKPRDERRSNVAAVMARLNAAADALPGIKLYLQPAQDIQIDTRVSRTQYQYTIQHLDPAELAIWSERLLEALSRQRSLRDVASDRQDSGLEVALQLNRDVTGRLGVPVQMVDDMLYDAFGQRQVVTVFTQVNQYRVILEADAEFRSDPSAIGRLYLPTPGGRLMPLTDLGTIEVRSVPLSIGHLAHFPATTLSFNLAQGAALSDALAAIRAAEAEIRMPDSVNRNFSGTAAEFRNSLATEPYLILAAIVVVYIVLGVLYESYIHPITILSTLPSAGVGALLALMLFGQDLSLISLVGIILLIGIVKKNAIMMIDFALDAERREKLPPEESIFQASILRFRPIMMTTMSALLGALPLVLESGTGSELRQPLGIATVGGLLISQVLTLYTTPVIYLYFARLSARLRPAATPVPVSGDDGAVSPKTAAR